jgi:hypothetical protein
MSIDAEEPVGPARLVRESVTVIGSTGVKPVDRLVPLVRSPDRLEPVRGFLNRTE